MVTMAQSAANWRNTRNRTAAPTDWQRAVEGQRFGQLLDRKVYTCCFTPSPPWRVISGPQTNCITSTITILIHSLRHVHYTLMRIGEVWWKKKISWMNRECYILIFWTCSPRPQMGRFSLKDWSHSDLEGGSWLLLVSRHAHSGP